MSHRIEAHKQSHGRIKAAGKTDHQILRSRRQFDANPFVPPDEHQFDARASEILSIQSTGLASNWRLKSVS